MQTNLLPAQPNEGMDSLSPQDVVKPPESTPVVAKKRSKLIIAWIAPVANFSSPRNTIRQ